MGHPETEAKRRTRTHSTREDSFLAELLAGRGVSDACKAAGISRSTGLRLRKSEEFQKRFGEARTELLSAAISQLHSNAGAFVTTLAAIATDEKSRGSDRVLASKHGLDLLLRGTETVELSERMAKLEASRAEKTEW